MSDLVYIGVVMNIVVKGIVVKMRVVCGLCILFYLWMSIGVLVSNGMRKVLRSRDVIWGFCFRYFRVCLVIVLVGVFGIIWLILFVDFIFLMFLLFLVGVMR